MAETVSFRRLLTQLPDEVEEVARAIKRVAFSLLELAAWLSLIIFLARALLRKGSAGP